SASVWLERRMADFDGALNVLRIMIAAAGDYDVLNAAGHVQFAMVHEAQVACAQEPSVTASKPCVTQFSCVSLVAPVAGGDMLASQPDFADRAVAHDHPGRWLHDMQVLSGDGFPAAYNSKPLAR